MIAKITPSADQVRWYAQSALNGFKTLSAEDAIENATADLQAMLAYLSALDAADDAVLVLGIEAIKSGVRLEVDVGQG